MSTAIALVDAHTDNAAIRRALRLTCRLDALVCRRPSCLAHTFQSRRVLAAWRERTLVRKCEVRRHMSWMRRLHGEDDPVVPY